MAKNQTYKAFVARPSHVLDMDGELQEGIPVMGQLVSEICGISAYATYVVRNDIVLGTELAHTTTVPAEAGRQAGVAGHVKNAYLGIVWFPSIAHGKSVLTR